MSDTDGLTCVREMRRPRGNGRLAKHVTIIASRIVPQTSCCRPGPKSKARSGMDNVMSTPVRILAPMTKMELSAEAAIARGPPVVVHSP